MSVDHHGIPESAYVEAGSDLGRQGSNVAGMSPDHKKAPHCWLPAQAERTRLTTSLSAGGAHAFVDSARMVDRVTVEHFAPGRAASGGCPRGRA